MYYYYHYLYYYVYYYILDYVDPEGPEVSLLRIIIITIDIITITISTTISTTIIREGNPQNEQVSFSFCLKTEPTKVVLNLSFLSSFELSWSGFRHTDSGTIDK